MLVTPRWSLAGTSPKSVLADALAAADALRAAMIAFRALHPNARDFVEPGSLAQAEDCFVADALALERVLGDIEVLASDASLAIR